MQFDSLHELRKLLAAPYFSNGPAMVGRGGILDPGSGVADCIFRTREANAYITGRRAPGHRFRLSHFKRGSSTFVAPPTRSTKFPDTYGLGGQGYFHTT